MPDFDEVEQSFLSEIEPVPACPPLELLRVHGQSVLPDEIESRLNIHLVQCQVCRMLLDDLSCINEPGLTQAARERIRKNVPVPQTTSPARRFRWYVASAIAASLALVAVFLSSGRFQQKSSPQVPTSPTTNSEPVTQLNLQVAKLAPPPTAESGLVFRGAVSGADPDADELAPAFAAYNKDDYSLAVSRFAKLASRFPRSDIPILYLGVSQLLEGDNAAAVESLAQAEQLAKPSRKDAATWYHAVAAVRVHSPDAPLLFRSLCNRHDSPYAQQACAVSTQLGEKPTH
jgi:hypothetical protein